FAAPHAARQNPTRDGAPLRDDILIDAIDGVVFVAPRLPAQAAVVDEAAPPLLHPIVFDADRQLVGCARELALVVPLEATAAELACEIHDAARSSQRGARIREVLHQIAVAVIAHDTQPIVFAERTLVRRAALHVTNGLAGIERDRVRRDLPRILLQLLACQTDRIL